MFLNFSCGLRESLPLYYVNELVMRTLDVNFWTKQIDETYVLYCSDARLGTDYTVTIPKRFNEIIDYSELKSGHLTLPSDYSIKVAS